MSTPFPTHVTVAPGPKGVAAVTAAARALLLESGPAFWPSPVDDPQPVTGPVPDDLAVILSTSGSTGDPLPVMISRAALTTAATAGASTLGPPGHWLTAVPVTSAGGLLTVVRALQSGAEPIAWPGLGGAEPFTAGSFLDAGSEVLRRAHSDGVPAYVSLVPTQVARILQSPPALEALAGFARVLVGGAALAPSIRALAERAGVHVVSTYGATETCGGVVFDGGALPGVQIHVEPHDASTGGRIVVAGDTIASGYLGRPDLTGQRFVDGRFRSSDLGVLTEAGLRVLGRVDEQVKVGGVLVSLAAVAEALRDDPRVLDAAVVADPDLEWGHRPRAYVVTANAAPATVATKQDLCDELGREVARRLGKPARPITISIVTELPTTPAGKPVSGPRREA